MLAVLTVQKEQRIDQKDLMIVRELQLIAGGVQRNEETT